MGKKLKFPSEKIFETACKVYLNKCLEKQEMPNIAGLCASLDIGRTTFYEYGKRYRNTIKRLESIIEDKWVQRLNEMAATGAIFYLKNAFREIYADKHEVEVKLPAPLDEV